MQLSYEYIGQFTTQHEELKKWKQIRHAMNPKGELQKNNQKEKKKMLAYKLNELNSSFSISINLTWF